MHRPMPIAIAMHFSSRLANVERLWCCTWRQWHALILWRLVQQKRLGEVLPFCVSLGRVFSHDIAHEPASGCTKHAVPCAGAYAERGSEREHCRAFFFRAISCVGEREIVEVAIEVMRFFVFCFGVST